MPARTNPRGKRIGDMPARWPLGVDNISELHEVDPRALRAGINVDIDKAGKVSRRAGYTLVDAGNWHSLFDDPAWPHFFAVGDGVLSAITPAGGTFEIVALANVSADRRMSICEHGGKLYYSNGVEFGTIDRNLRVGAWGVEPPGDGFTVAGVSTGGLASGTYSVCLTYMAANGEESAPTDAAYVVVAEGGGIALGGLTAAPAGIAATRVYLSACNGDVLYWLKDLAPAATLALLGKTAAPGKALETRMMERVRPGVNLRSLAGRIYWIDVERPDRIGYTLALHVGLTEPTKNYLWYGGAIALFETVEGGAYLGTDKAIYYLAGREPSAFNQTTVRGHGAIPGTARMVNGSVFGGSSPVAVFWSTDGVMCRGGPGGALTPMTERRLALPEYERGATLFRESKGIRQLVTTMNRGSMDAGVAAVDTAVAEVMRNGVVIN